MILARALAAAADNADDYSGQLWRRGRVACGLSVRTGRITMALRIIMSSRAGRFAGLRPAWALRQGELGVREGRGLQPQPLEDAMAGSW